jgi:hypothetical protein
MTIAASRGAAGAVVEGVVAVVGAVVVALPVPVVVVVVLGDWAWLTVVFGEIVPVVLT